MESTGKITQIAKDTKSNRLILTIALDTWNAAELQILGDNALDVKISRHRNKRSIDANAYAWLLMSKLASCMETSKEEVYELMLNRYGALATDDEGLPITLTVKSEVDMGRIDGHFKFFKGSTDGKWKSYLVILGTSEYDTKQMSTFIDGLVSECKELGIETLPPDELERMYAEMSKR